MCRAAIREIMKMNFLKTLLKKMDNDKCSMDKNTHAMYHLFNLTHKLLEDLPFFWCRYVLMSSL